MIEKNNYLHYLLHMEVMEETNRSVSLDKLNNFRVLCDTSSIEIFINNGEEVFTTRFYPTKDNVGINLSGENLKGSICIYEMEAYKIEN